MIAAPSHLPPDAQRLLLRRLYQSRCYSLSKNRLYFTVFREDNEAGLLWEKVTGVPRSHVFRLGEKENFRQMGETGPCGPSRAGVARVT